MAGGAAATAAEERAALSSFNKKGDDLWLGSKYGKVAGPNF